MMKVALVHDYLREYRDVERVLRVLHRIYPHAPVYTAFVDKAQLGQASHYFSDWDIRPTVAQQLPGISRFHQRYQSLLPRIWEALDFSAYDLVISLSGDYRSQSVLTHSHTLHVSYCYTPSRSLWEPTQPQSQRWFQTWSHTQLRQYDFYAAQRVDRFVTTSESAARRIRKFYRRTTDIIPPPIPIHGTGTAGTDYYLYVGPLDRFHQVDLAIQACQQLDRPLWIVGTGSETALLQQLAKKTTRFLGAVPEAEMASIYQGAIALLYPSAYEDFAFSPVEAMGYGIPVIASELSGLKDVILNYRTGLLFAQPTVDTLCNTILQFEKLRFSSQACIQRAEEFAEPGFIAKFEWFIAKALDDYHSHHAPTIENASANVDR